MSIIIDDTDLINVNVRAKLESDIPMTPETRDKTIEVPGRHGAYDLGAYYGALPINLECSILGKSMSDVQYSARELKRLLLDQYGKPKTVKVIIPEIDSDKFYNARLQGGVSIDRLAAKGDFSLPMTAHDPHAYSTVHADDITWGNEVLTFESFYLLGHEGSAGMVDITAPTTKTISVSGYALRPIIEISGSADELTVTNNGQSFSLPSFSNADWEIDCERYTVKKDGQSAFGEVGLREFWLYPGDNDVQIDGNNIDISMRIRFRDKWM